MKRFMFRVTLADCEVDTFRAGGNGGQKQNKTSSGVRVTHRPSGAIGESRDTRSQTQNKKSAFFKMASSPKFKAWAWVQAMTQPADFLEEYLPVKEST